MTGATACLLGAAGFAAGFVNAVAGGGTFITLPALVAAGLPSVAANATSTVALYPAAFASAIGYRGVPSAPVGQARHVVLLAASLVGGAAGAGLLLTTSSRSFDAIVPWLLLVGSLAYAFGRDVGAWLRRRIRIGTAAVTAAQFALGVYGGYFGGAVGVMMMAVWSLLGPGDQHGMQANKAMMVGATNTVAVAAFAVAGIVRWPEALVVLVAAAVASYVGARVARRLDARCVHRWASVFNLAMTAAFFWRAYAS